MDFLPEAVIEMAHRMTVEGRHREGDATGVQPERYKATIAAGTQLAHYKIMSLLGAGGMGEVYLAEDIATQTQGCPQNACAGTDWR